MGLSVCPSEVAHAPASTVWRLLANPREYTQWIDAHVASITPDRSAVPGQRILLRAPTWGRWFTLWIEVERADSTSGVLELTTSFPFGLVLRNRIAVAPLDAQTCRVQFG
jgi:hypothetical protein